jgi:N-methylhydantoinase A
MPKSLLLNIGESFAEIAVVGPDGIGQRHHWLMGRGPVNKPLTQFLGDQPVREFSEILVNNQFLHGLLRRRHGGQIAFITTSGFEDWLPMNRPIRQNYFTVQADRAPALVEQNLVFGLSERMSARGVVEKPAENADLEFLSEKLKLHEVEDVAVGLLHSQVNGETEKQVGAFLREKGFTVHLSSDFSRGTAESPRWWAAVVNAYLSKGHRELVSEIKSGLEEAGFAELPQRWMGGQGLLNPVDPASPLQSLFGSIAALGKCRQRRGVQALLYLGLEDFFLVDGRWHEREVWQAEFGPVAAQHPGFVRCDLQPSQMIGRTFWGSVGIQGVEGKFEPGPMCFGRGLVPQFVDILWLRQRLGDINSWTDRIQEKSRTRVEEVLKSASRESGRPHLHSAQELATALEKDGAKRLAAQIGWGVHEILIGGPLASAVRPSLDPVLSGLDIKAQWVTDSPLLLEALADFASGTDGGKS